MSEVQVIQTSDTPGVEIRSVNLAQGLGAETFWKIEDAFNRYGSFSRDQDITPQQQMNLAKLFSDVLNHINKRVLHPDDLGVMIRANITENGCYISVADAGTTWHTDMSVT